MKNQSVHRFPKAANGCLARLFVVIALLAGYGDCFASPAVDPVPPSRISAEVDLVWVRQDPPVINVNNDPTEYVEPAGLRFEGSYWKYTITDTEIAWDARSVDHDYEWYKVKMKTVFDRPPIFLNPPLPYKVTATASHSGTSQEPSPGFQFWYNSPGGSLIEPKEVLPYYPFDPKFTGLSSKDWMINPPAALHEGATFKIYASWWNCPPCNVTWTYIAEPANAVPRLGVEVVQPIVIYQDQEVAPGDIFFPETCPTATSQKLGKCSNKIKLRGGATTKWQCMHDTGEKLHLIINALNIGRSEAMLSVVKALLKQRCGHLHKLDRGCLVEPGRSRPSGIGSGSRGDAPEQCGRWLNNQC